MSFILFAIRNISDKPSIHDQNRIRNALIYTVYTDLHQKKVMSRFVEHEREIKTKVSNSASKRNFNN